MHVVSQTKKTVTVVNQKGFDTTQTTIQVKSIDPLIDDSSSDGSPTATFVELSNKSSGLNELPSMDDKFSLAEPTTPEVRAVSHLILDIIFEYALNKFDDSKERLAAGAAKFLRDIDRFVVAGTRVEACLPAFPFKSVSPWNKRWNVTRSALTTANCIILSRQIRYTKYWATSPIRPKNWHLSGSTQCAHASSKFTNRVPKSPSYRMV